MNRCVVFMKKYVLSLAIAMASFTATAQERYYVEILAGKTEQESETVDSAAFAFRGGFQFSDYVAFELAYQDYGSNEFQPEFRFSSIVDAVPEFIFNPDLLNSEGGFIAAPFPELPEGIDSSPLYALAPGDISIESNTTAINAGVKGRYPLTESLSIIGRIGASRTTIEIDATLPALNIGLVGGVIIFNETGFQNSSITEKGTSLYYGLGVQYEINDRFFAGLEYDLNNVEFGSADIKNETLSLSAGFKF